MVTDGNKIENNRVENVDICIIGAGAAGITIAKEFKGTNKTVALVESGGFEPNYEVQKLYEGKCEHKGIFEKEGDEYLFNSRMRYFGGTTSRWGGWCVELDDIDFEKKETQRRA